MATSFDPSPSLVQRRKRGTATSCNECRRLKLKCSRVFPCSNCVKKGCGQICPEGSLTTGKGNRFVLASTEVLHEKIGQLATRVRQLEDALSDSHKLTSNQTHPLLSEELLQIKRPLERERVDLPSSKDEKHDSKDTIDAIGSLSISHSGRSTFFGQAANSWYLLQNEEGSEEDELPEFAPPLPSDVPWLAHAFPFTFVTSTGNDVRRYLLQVRPDRNTAEHLCNIYYRHAAWMYTPITEGEFYESVFRPLYVAESEGAIGAHSLAVFYMVLALGTLLDLDRPSHNPESTQFYQLGRAALSIDSVLDEQSIPAIQAMLLMCHFMFWNDIEEPRWAIMGLVAKLAQSLGLHRDSAKWNLDEQESYRRRCLMWEIYTYDSLQSLLTFARPPSFSLLHVDCKLPHETTDQKNTLTGRNDMSFVAWKHAFCAQCLSVVQDQAFSARAPTYKTIQELDKKVRLFYVPPNLQVAGFGSTRLNADSVPPSTELTMQRYITFAVREMTLFYMHRGFFAHALEECPNDPMGSKYSPSVLAAYTGACTFVGLVESLFKQHPALTERMWFVFTHVFSCAIVLGSIAQKPQMAISRSALSHLDSAYNLFLSVSDKKRTAKILPILQRLQERAHLSMVTPASPETNGPKLSLFGPAIKSEVDEIAALAGTTRLVARKKSNSPSNHASPASQSASPPPAVTHSPPQQYNPPGDWHSYPSQECGFSPYSQSPTHSDNSSAVVYNQQTQTQIQPLEVMSDYYYQTPQRQTPNHNGQGYDPYSTYPQNGMNEFAGSLGSFPDLNLTWQNFVAQYK